MGTKIKFTSPQANFLWSCMHKGKRGLIAYGHERRTAKSLARRKLIRLCGHNICFPNGLKYRPWTITSKGYHAFWRTEP